MSEHVIFVACTVDAKTPHDAMTLLGESLNAGRTRFPEFSSWWIAQDDRNDGSDNDSAVMVLPGLAHEAGKVLLEEGLTVGANVPAKIEYADMDATLRSRCDEETSLLKRIDDMAMSEVPVDTIMGVIGRNLSDADLTGFMLSIIESEIQVFPDVISSELFENMSVNLYADNGEQASDFIFYLNGDADGFVFDELIFTRTMIITLLMYITFERANANPRITIESHEILTNMGLIA